MEIKNKPLNDIRGKQVLLVGLGILGGGVATAKWLVEQGANLTITDLKNADYLSQSIAKLKKLPIKYVLGKHDERDFKNVDLIVLNPDVPYNSKFVNIAKENNIPITNELFLFDEFVKSKNVIAVTGTRGKTTTVNWIGFLMNELFGTTYIVGNDPKMPFLKAIKSIKEKDNVVLEVPSYHLEIDQNNFKPKVAIITNIYIDHIARHNTELNYADTKANIFANQDEGDFLILNADNKWTKGFLAKDLKQNILLFSAKKLPKKIKDGIYLSSEGGIILRSNGVDTLILKSKDFPRDFGDHNKSNLMIAILVLNVFSLSSRTPRSFTELNEKQNKNSFLFSSNADSGSLLTEPGDAGSRSLRNLIPKLPKIKIREEKIYEDKKLIVINDSAATSPEATVAAINRFNSPNSFFIVGGTDKGLEYKELGKFISKKVKPENLILLGGSATEKLKQNLRGRKFNEFETLEECLGYAKDLIRASRPSSGLVKTIVFSPGAKSFEKFKNEFDRGEKFNKLFKKIFHK